MTPEKKQAIDFATWLLEYVLIFDGVPEYRIMRDVEQPKSIEEWYSLFKNIQDL